VDHAVDVAGIDHVGLSGDFDGGGGVLGWDNAAESPHVTAALLERGYSEEDLAKIWGRNLLRVMRDVQAAATQ
jgi:membrane dipeptidase